ncbi:MAG: hypothetical protein P8N02_16750 [Actinomycetota bacterium]|nr:hypothetical protein [Actinomycetota bacterium]
MTTGASYRTTEQSPDDLEAFPVELGPDTVLELLTGLFTEHWSTIRFGPLIAGAVFELAATAPPRLSVLDGYLTVNLGASHLHLCVGEHVGTPGRPVSPEIARRRLCHRAELQRLWVDGAPRSWMVRLFNGDDHQMLTILLPNPFLDDRQMPLAEPDWSRLTLWDELRRVHLGHGPDDADRLGKEFVHA